MDLLGNLLGGGQQRDEYQDFVRRYDQGDPWDGISDDEAVNRYRQVAQQAPPDVYQESAQQAFSRLTPQQRREFAQYLQQAAQQQGYRDQDLDGDGVADRLEDAGSLGRVTTRMHQQQPYLLEQLLGGGGGGAGQMTGASGLGGLVGSAVQEAAVEPQGCWAIAGEGGNGGDRRDGREQGAGRKVKTSSRGC